MSCRRPTPADVRVLAAAHVRAWQAAYAGIMPDAFLRSLSVDAFASRWVAWLAAEPAEALVVETEGRVVGFSFFGPCRDDDVEAESAVGEIRAINLDPDFWRRGLGTELLRASLRELRAAGHATAILWVLQENVRGRHFYEAQGWRPDGGEKQEAPPGCPPLAHLRYRIALGPEEGRPAPASGSP